MLDIALYPVAILIAFSFCVLMGLPWLIATWLWWRFSLRTHIALRVGVAATLSTLGVAPYIYAHGAMPIYIAVLVGGEIPVRFMAVSFSITFLVAAIFFAVLARRTSPLPGMP